MKILSRVKNSVGFRDYRFLRIKHKPKLFFSVMSEMTPKRFLKYVKNVPFALGKSSKNSSISPVGIIEVWLQNSSCLDTDGFGYEKLVQHFFKSQAICIDYNKKVEKIVVGLDNGHIVCLKYNHDSGRNIELVFDKQIHKKRVMGVHINHKKGLIYSIGEDKSFVCSSIENGQVENRLEVGKKKLTLMHNLDSENVALVSDRAGHIHFIDISGVKFIILFLKFPNLVQNSPTIKQTLNTGFKAAVRGFDIDKDDGKIFVCSYDTGTIAVYQMKTPIQADNRVKKLVSIDGYKKPRVLKYWKKRNELYVGHAKGKIVVYDLKNQSKGPVCNKNLVFQGF